MKNKQLIGNLTLFTEEYKLIGSYPYTTIDKIFIYSV